MAGRFLSALLVISIVAIAALLASCDAFGRSPAASQGNNSAVFETARVVRVVDGDTIIFDVDGAERKCRLCGIDAPESVHPDDSRNSEEGIAACSFVRGVAPEGAVMYLQADTITEDKYGRILRYAWFEMPTMLTDENEIASKMLNAAIVSNGYAQAKRYEGETLYSDVFFRLQQNAVSGNLGVSYLWR